MTALAGFQLLDGIIQSNGTQEMIAVTDLSNLGGCLYIPVFLNRHSVPNACRYKVSERGRVKGGVEKWVELGWYILT